MRRLSWDNDNRRWVGPGADLCCLHGLGEPVYSLNFTGQTIATWHPNGNIEFHRPRHPHQTREWQRLLRRLTPAWCYRGTHISVRLQNQDLYIQKFYDGLTFRVVDPRAMMEHPEAFLVIDDLGMRRIAERPWDGNLPLTQVSYTFRELHHYIVGDEVARWTVLPTWVDTLTPGGRYFCEASPLLTHLHVREALTNIGGTCSATQNPFRRTRNARGRVVRRPLTLEEYNVDPSAWNLCLVSHKPHLQRLARTFQLRWSCNAARVLALLGHDLPRALRSRVTLTRACERLAQLTGYK